MRLLLLFNAFVLAFTFDDARFVRVCIFSRLCEEKFADVVPANLAAANPPICVISAEVRAVPVVI